MRLDAPVAGASPPRALPAPPEGKLPPAPAEEGSAGSVFHSSDHSGFHFSDLLALPGPGPFHLAPEGIGLQYDPGGHLGTLAGGPSIALPLQGQGGEPVWAEQAPLDFDLPADFFGGDFAPAPAPATPGPAATGTRPGPWPAPAPEAMPGGPPPHQVMFQLPSGGHWQYVAPGGGGAADAAPPARPATPRTAPPQRQRRRATGVGGSRARSTSQYRGVTHHCRTGRWEAHIWEGGKQVYLGGFRLEQQAALSYDLAAIKCRGHEAITNFPLDNYQQELASLESISKQDLILSLRLQSRGKKDKPGTATSGTSGVDVPPNIQEIIERMLMERYQVVGTFDTEKEAAVAWDKEQVLRHGKAAATNFDIRDYEEQLRAIGQGDEWGGISAQEVEAAAVAAVAAMANMHSDAKKAVAAKLSAAAAQIDVRLPGPPTPPGLR